MVIPADDGGGQAQIQTVQQVHPEDGEHDPADTEDAGLDHGHGMEQGADRGGGDHGRGQPVMEGHDGRLGQPGNIKDVGDGHQQRVGVGGKHALLDPHGEIQGAGHDIGEDNGRQQKGLGRAGQVDHVLAAPLEGLGVLMMGHQGVGVDGDEFVEEIKAEQIPGKGHAHGPDDGHGKAVVVAGLGVFLQGAHVADIVKGNHDPEERRNGGEEHPQGVHPEFKADSRQDNEGGAFDRFCRPGPPGSWRGRSGKSPRRPGRTRPPGDWASFWRP